MRDRTRHEKVEETTGIFGGVRLITLKSGRKVSFWEAEREQQSSLSDLQRWMSRMGKLAEGEEFLEDALERRVDEVEEWVKAWRRELEKRAERERTREKIAALRDTTGRTPEEAALYAKKADQLEARL